MANKKKRRQSTEKVLRGCFWIVDSVSYSRIRVRYCFGCQSVVKSQPKSIEEGWTNWQRYHLLIVFCHFIPTRAKELKLRQLNCTLTAKKHLFPFFFLNYAKAKSGRVTVENWSHVFIVFVRFSFFSVDNFSMVHSKLRLHNWHVTRNTKRN